MEIFGATVGSVEATIVLIVAVMMAFFARKELASRRAGGNADYKSLIVSIGVLGTFVGIFLGLWAFNTEDIQGSVPSLLEGLKLAFVTSIMGMAVSVFLSGMERSDSGAFADEGATLASMDRKLSGLQSIAEDTTAMNGHLEEMRREIREEQTASRQFIEQQFVRTNESLDKAIETLAEGVTSEIIEALESVIQDFNDNLTEQFGDNFKQLNEAVLRLVDWQENYRLQVEKSTDLLNGISESLDDTDRTLAHVAERNEALLQLHEELRQTLVQHVQLLETSGAHIDAQKALVEQASLAMTGFENSLDQTAKNVSDLSEGVRESVTAQAKTLKTLTSDIEAQLPKALGELDQNLAGLTQRFATDYQSFLDRYQSLVASNSGSSRS